MWARQALEYAASWGAGPGYENASSGAGTQIGVRETGGFTATIGFNARMFSRPASSMSSGCAGRPSRITTEFGTGTTWVAADHRP